MAPGLLLHAGRLRCELRPDLGGCIAGLWWDGLPVLRSSAASALASVRQSACYPLLPFSNRIGQARFHWQGQEHVLAANFPPEPHAIHGVGWQRAWACGPSDGNSDGRSARLHYRHAGDAGWPFAFDAVQDIHLADDSLTLRLTLTNRASHAVPAGLGWHPYLAKRADSHLAFSAAQRWEMGPDKLPTHALPSLGLQQACAGLNVDHCFDGWQGSAELRDSRLRLHLTSDLRRLVVFTDPARDFVAVEPVSHVNNALQLAEQPGQDALALGLAVLQPGHSHSAWLRLAVQPASSTDSFSPS